MAKTTTTKAQQTSSIAKKVVSNNVSKNTGSSSSNSKSNSYTSSLSNADYKQYEKDYNYWKKTGKHTDWYNTNKTTSGIATFKNIKGGKGKSALSNGTYYYMDNDTYDKYGRDYNNWKNNGNQDSGDTSWRKREELDAFKLIRSSRNNYENSFDDFRYSLNDDVVKATSDAYKKQWGDKYYYDYNDPEDMARQANGQMPKYLESKYDLGDPFGKYLYENNLPYNMSGTGGFSDMYSEAYKDWYEGTSGPEYQNQYQSFLNELAGNMHDERDASSGVLDNIVADLLTNGSYDRIASNFKARESAGESAEDRISGYTKNKKTDSKITLDDIYRDVLDAYTRKTSGDMYEYTGEDGITHTISERQLMNAEAIQKQAEQAAENGTKSYESQKKEKDIDDKIKDIEQQIWLATTSEYTDKDTVDALYAKKAELEDQKSKLIDAERGSIREIADANFNARKNAALEYDLTNYNNEKNRREAAYASYDEKIEELEKQMEEVYNDVLADPSDENVSKFDAIKAQYDSITNTAFQDVSSEETMTLQEADAVAFQTLAKYENNPVHNPDTSKLEKDDAKLYKNLIKSEWLTESERGALGNAVEHGDADAIKEFEHIAQIHESEYQNAETARKAEMDPTAKSVASVANKIPSAFETAFNVGKAVVSLDKTNPIDWQYNSKYTRMTNTIRGTVSQDIIDSNTDGNFLGMTNGEMLSKGYQLLMSMADSGVTMLASMGTGAVAGPVAAGITSNVGLAATGLNAMNSTILDCYEKGYNTGVSLQLGLISGTTEFITEKLNIDRLFEASATGTLPEFLKEVFWTQSMPEGCEELISSVVEYMAEWQIANKKWDTKEFIADLAESFVGGYLSGMGFGAIGQGVRLVNGETKLARIDNNARQVSEYFRGKVNEESIEYNGEFGEQRQMSKMAIQMTNDIMTINSYCNFDEETATSLISFVDTIRSEPELLLSESASDSINKFVSVMDDVARECETQKNNRALRVQKAAQRLSNIYNDIIAFRDEAGRHLEERNDKARRTALDKASKAIETYKQAQKENSVQERLWASQDAEKSAKIVDKITDAIEQENKSINEQREIKAQAENDADIMMANAENDIPEAEINTTTEAMTNGRTDEQNGESGESDNIYGRESGRGNEGESELVYGTENEGSGIRETAEMDAGRNVYSEEQRTELEKRLIRPQSEETQIVLNNLTDTLRTTRGLEIKAVPVNPSDVSDEYIGWLKQTANILGKSAEGIISYTQDFAPEGSPYGFNYNGEIGVRNTGSSIDVFHLWHEIGHKVKAYRDVIKAALGDSYESILDEYINTAPKSQKSYTREQMGEEMLCDLFGSYGYTVVTGGAVDLSFIDDANRVMSEQAIKETLGNNLEADESSDIDQVKMSDGFYEKNNKEHYDYSNTFAEQIRDLKNGKIPRGDSLVVCGTPKVFKDIGLNDLPVIINTNHVVDTIRGNRDDAHTILEKDFSLLPERLNNPIAITTSWTNKDKSIVAYIDMEAKNGQKSIVPIYFNSSGKENNLTIDSNSISTVFGKNNCIEKLTEAINGELKGNIEVFYLNKEKAQMLYSLAGVQFPGYSIRDGHIHNIYEEGSPVNNVTKIKQTETSQFKKWFRNSPFRNNDGTPKIYYHGTPNGTFNAFNNWSYFTDNSDYADVYQYPGASSISRFKDVTYPKTYDVYLTASNVFDTRKKSCLDVYNNEFLNKYGNGTPLSKRGLPDWTDGSDLIEFFEDKGYDFDAIILDEGATGGYGEEVKDRGISVLVKSSNQVKSATENIGLFDSKNPNINYSDREVLPATRQESIDLDIDDERNVARYQNEVKSVLEGTFPSWDNVLIGNPTSLLSKHMGSNNPIYIGQKAIQKAIDTKQDGGKHGLGIDLVNNLIDHINDPLAITKNTTDHKIKNDHSIVVWTNMFTETGDPIIAPIRIDIADINGKGLHNEVTTIFDVYNPNYLEDLINDENVLYTRENKNIRDLLSQWRQLPKSHRVDVSNDNIEDSIENVKYSDREITAGNSDSATNPLARCRADVLDKAIGLYEQGVTPSEYLKSGNYDNAVAAQLRGMMLRNGQDVGGKLSDDKLEPIVSDFVNYKKQGIMAFDTAMRAFDKLGKYRDEKVKSDAAYSEAVCLNLQTAGFYHDNYTGYLQSQKRLKNLFMEKASSAVAEIGANDAESVLAQLVGERIIPEDAAMNAVEDRKYLLVPLGDGAMVLSKKNGRVQYLADGESLITYSDPTLKQMIAVEKEIKDIRANDDGDIDERIREAKRRTGKPLETPQATKLVQNGSHYALVNCAGETIFEMEGSNAYSEKVNKLSETLAGIYSDMHKAVQNVLVENGYKPIGKIENYFPHGTFGDSGINGFLDQLRSEDLSVDLAGMTKYFVPGKPWNGHMLERLGDVTDYHAVRGFDQYLRGVSDVIYMTPVIQRFRQLENAMRTGRTSKTGTQYATNNELSSFVSWLHDYTNKLANKKADLDRSTEGMFDRRIYTLPNKLAGAIGTAYIGGNVRTALTNLASFTQGAGQIKPKYVANAIMDVIHETFGNKMDDFNEKCSFIVNRTSSADETITNTGIKMKAVGEKALFGFIEATDNFSTKTIARAKYYDYINQGMSEDEAMKETTRFCINLFADRSKGNKPAIFESQVLNPVTQFQIEPMNMLNHYGDIHRENVREQYREILRKNNGVLDGVDWKNVENQISRAGVARKDIAMILGRLFATSLYGILMRLIAGGDASWNPAGIVYDVVQGGKEDGFDGAVKALKDDVYDNIPFSSLIQGIASNFDNDYKTTSNIPMPYLSGIVSFSSNLAKGDILGAASYVVPGGSQIRKTYRGIEALAKGGVYDSNGKLKYPVEANGLNIMRGTLFGTSAMEPMDGYKKLSNAKTAQYKQAVENGLNSDDIYYLLGQYSGNGANALKALEIATSDRDGDGNADFNKNEQDLIAEILGIEEYTKDKAKGKYESFQDYAIQKAEAAIKKNPNKREEYEIFLDMLGVN